MPLRMSMQFSRAHPQGRDNVGVLALLPGALCSLSFTTSVSFLHEYAARTHLLMEITSSSLQPAAHKSRDQIACDQNELLAVLLSLGLGYF